ncbi:MAG: hypothetical protein ACI4S2_03755 [Lachnospiraceae bacterium]
MIEKIISAGAYGIPQNLYEVLWLFILYAFLGWCIEVIFHAVNKGIFVNRGFLNGPYCPMYGVGMVMVSFILPLFKKNILILFVASFIFASALEFVTGFLLEKIFHNKWWDYSNLPFNIMGYICLKFSIYWGLGGVLMFTTIHPMIYSLVKMIPHIAGVIFMVVFYIFFAGDLIVTVMTILKFNKRVRVLDEMAKKMKEISDEFGEKVLFEGEQKIEESKKEFEETHEELLTRVSETTEAAKGKLEETKDKLAETTEAARDKFVETTEAARDKFVETTEAARDKFVETTETARDKFVETTEAAKDKITETAINTRIDLELRKEQREEQREERRLQNQKELQELQEKYKALLTEKSRGFKHLVKAFPDMTSKYHNEILQKYKQQINSKKK